MRKGEFPTKIKTSLNRRTLAAFRYQDQEVGGALGIRNGEIVCHYLDQSGASGAASYHPNTEELSAAIGRFFLEAGCDDFCFVHSHPAGCSRLSYADLQFARSFLRLNPGRTHVCMALVVDEQIRFFCLDAKSGELREVPLELTE